VTHSRVSEAQSGPLRPLGAYEVGNTLPVTLIVTLRGALRLSASFLNIFLVLACSQVSRRFWRARIEPFPLLGISYGSTETAHRVVSDKKTKTKTKSGRSPWP